MAELIKQLEADKAAIRCRSEKKPGLYVAYRTDPTT